MANFWNREVGKLDLRLFFVLVGVAALAVSLAALVAGVQMYYPLAIFGLLSFGVGIAMDIKRYLNR